MDPRGPTALLRASLDGIAREAMTTLRIRGVRLAVSAATLGAVCVEATTRDSATLERTTVCLCDAVTCIAGALGHRDLVEWIVGERIAMSRAETMPAPKNDSSNEMEASR